MKARLKQHACAALAALSMLTASLAPRAALANPPATVATCDGIKAAYLSLGLHCWANSRRIDHPPATLDARLFDYKARVEMVQFFQKALLCNGMYGATPLVQKRFSSEVDSQLTAIAKRHAVLVAGDYDDIPALYTASDLKSITMTKEQCK